jgi:hemerythrin-like domain-containing protein
MTEEVSRILGELRQDHRNMALMLNLLEQESNKINEGHDPDLELVHDIMQYMTVYPDAVHHPKEDRIYAELRSVRPDLSTGFSRITEDHRGIAEQGAKLRDEVAAIESGGAVRRKTLVSDLLRYVNTLRSHMQWEELDLFHRVEEMIAEGHNFIDPANLPHSSDPVFGAEVEETFGRLFSSIERARAAN